ncbi:sterile alpha motif-like domain-containing protein [Streptomyces olivaceus]|uniref:YozE family protein n=1 Tax=Streptomyces olivaceus TaxID=47716 RepID=UPI001CCF03D0|nr:YozE family protein [Streptomyces olivaceus]MBZ6205798.1 sterile alpha motif-like domain-containing protein [Streptomyces olivaceus]
MSNLPESFYEWLMRCVDEQSPVGDLARDARDDDTWPDGEESYDLCVEYLESLNAYDGALDALEEAWRRYDNFRNPDAP